jgi:hypothetical protein
MENVASKIGLARVAYSAMDFEALADEIIKTHLY